MMRVRAIVTTLVLCFAASAVRAEEARTHTFGGYKCILDCSGHRAGYQWAESYHVTDADECEKILERTPNRTSFYEGCMTYVEDPDHGPDPDPDADEDLDEDRGEYAAASVNEPPQQKAHLCAPPAAVVQMTVKR